MTQPAAMPAIAIGPAFTPPLPFETDGNLLAAIATMAVQVKGSLGHGVGTTVAALVAEGRRFRETPGGRRWNAMLEGSELVQNGWMLWNLLDMDRFLTGRDQVSGEDTPGRLIEEMLRQIQGARIEELVDLVNAIWRTEAGHA